MAIRAKKIQPAKTEAIANAKNTLSEFNDFIFAEYRGLTVEQITALRDKLREKNAELHVFKNNFAKIAFDELKVENVADYLSGPTVIAMTKENYDLEKITAYSKVPGKKQLYAMLMSAMNGPVRQLAATIKAYADKLEAEGK